MIFSFAHLEPLAAAVSPNTTFWVLFLYACKTLWHDFEPECARTRRLLKKLRILLPSLHIYLPKLCWKDKRYCDMILKEYCIYLHVDLINSSINAANFVWLKLKRANSWLNICWGIGSSRRDWRRGFCFPSIWSRMIVTTDQEFGRNTIFSDVRLNDLTSDFMPSHSDQEYPNTSLTLWKLEGKLD